MAEARDLMEHRLKGPHLREGELQLPEGLEEMVAAAAVAGSSYRVFRSVSADKLETADMGAAAAAVQGLDFMMRFIL